MIDFAKIEISDPHLPDRLRRNLDRPLWSTVDTHTGQQGEGGTLHADLFNLRLTCHPSGLNHLTGSLHKFANEGFHNHDDFTATRLRHTVGQLCDLLDTAPKTPCSEP